jgi:hypothetical protein
VASISIQFSLPQNGAVFWGPKSGVGVDVSYTATMEAGPAQRTQVGKGSAEQRYSRMIDSAGIRNRSNIVHKPARRQGRA